MMALCRLTVLAAIWGMLSLSSAHAETVTICTAMDAATGEILKQEGTCDTRATPASILKIAISLMGLDAGFLKDAHTPALPFEEGYVDWTPAWQSTTDPAKWMKDSVVWYSQQVTKALGKERFGRYVREFQFGNEMCPAIPARTMA